MINVTKQKRNTIYYKCDCCNTNGMCTIKPTEDDSTIVIELTCPICHEHERITLVQYSSEENKKDLLDNLEELDISWVLTQNEEVSDTGE
jgi:hypothetical protein